MKYFLLWLFQCLVTLPALAQLDAGLLQEDEDWKRGETPPPRLLQFPDGKIDAFSVGHMRVVGEHVSHYISKITNPELLAALLLHPRAKADTVRAVTYNLLKTQGVEHVRRLLEGQSRSALRSELAVLAELLRSPYAALQVARITYDDVAPIAAERSLQEMRAELLAGDGWTEVYRKAAAKHPDRKVGDEEPQSVGTHVCYLYDSVVSPTGFDILTYAFAADLPPEHLAEIFRAGSGTHVLKTKEAVYIYHFKPE